jgi:hypothetical protein
MISMQRKFGQIVVYAAAARFKTSEAEPVEQRAQIALQIVTLALSCAATSKANAASGS